jgi:hypothetical protein
MLCHQPIAGPSRNRKHIRSLTADTIGNYEMQSKIISNRTLCTPAATTPSGLMGAPDRTAIYGGRLCTFTSL